jgi:plasmid stabilization system protein ParE
MAFVLNIRRKAFAEIRQTVSWLATHISAATASRWQERTNTVLQSLEDDPHRHPPADEAADLGLDLRELLFGRGRNVYRVLFTIDGESVNVHRVRHAAQDRLRLDDL